MKNNTVKKLMREGLAKLGAVQSVKTTWGEHYDLNTQFGLLTVGLHDDMVHGRGKRQLVSCYSCFADTSRLPKDNKARVMLSITNSGSYTGKYNWIHYAESFVDEAEYVNMVLNEIELEFFI